MKYTILYGKLSKSGVGDVNVEFDTFDSLEEAKDVLEHIDEYLTSREISDWSEVQEGDYLEFDLYAESENSSNEYIDSNAFDGVIYSAHRKTNKQ